ncbi:phage portal protein [Allopusillimonas ginsengisoli]|uniref:phage portal protein n=1 Tax=Allopusillimonas ginsengisoli TaxID=453575 RepID=UPI00101F3FA5|nr:phage portal protein [Allopusillimonas ginsengisoli]TEA79829.1 phage portal protein [Allopusillimonas ginsengisoli]
MGLFNIFRHKQPEASARPQASAQGHSFSGMDDPALLEYIRAGHKSDEALRNMAALRCVSLICESIGMLPANVIRSGPEKQLAKEHPSYRLLKLRPNTWQTPYEFKSQMQLSALMHGDAYARIVWSRNKPVMWVPLPFESVKAKLRDDWTMVYEYTRKDGGLITLEQRDVFHLRDLSLDGVAGLSRMRLARGAIKLAQDAETAAAKIFETGNMAGGAIEVPKGLSDQAYARMQKSLREDYSGVENSGKWMILEEQAKANKFAATAKESQHIENRNAQIEEVARAFGVPRPLLMMDDTSWGSGIEQLGIFFIQYGLQHWFTAWEQAIARSMFSDAEMDQLYVKFNEKALLRGTLKDQSDGFAKALGAGGIAPWMTQNEVRDNLDMPAFDDPQANQLRNPMTQKGKGDESDKAAGN